MRHASHVCHPTESSKGKLEHITSKALHLQTSHIVDLPHTPIALLVIQAFQDGAVGHSIHQT